MCFSMQSGIIPGRHHIIYGLNCQDSLQTKTFKHQDDTYYIGVVSDGCGEGTRSEVGAHIATSFLAKRTEELLRKNVSVKKIPQRLFIDLLIFLKSFLNNFFSSDTPPQTIVDFIKNHLLFTVIGFLITPKHTIIFSMGDGVVLLNDLIDIKDENNHPNYIAYHLVDGEYLVKDRTPLPDNFHVLKIPTKYLEKLAVGTDAWTDEVGIFLSLFNKDVCKSVQRTMNVMSKKERRFKDDAAIITVTRMDKKEVVDESESGE